GQILQRTNRHRERAGPADGVVDLCRCAVEGDLHVDVVAAGEASGDLRGDAYAVGGELHAHVMLGRIVDQRPKVRSHRGFATADVDVEHLHTFQLVDDVLALPR